MPNPHIYSGIRAETVTRRPDGTVEMVDSCDWYVEQSKSHHNNAHNTEQDKESAVKPLGKAGRKKKETPTDDAKLQEAVDKDLSKRNVRRTSKKKPN